MILDTVKKIIKNPYKIFSVISGWPIFRLMPDEMFLKLKFRGTVGYPLNLDSPQTYNEKLQWLKLHDRKPIYTTMVDKYAVKKYVANKIGNEYIIPTIGVWDKFEDIDFNQLPDQFVLKCTHDSGGLVICRDKRNLDISAAKKKIAKSLKNNYYYNGREWPYKNVRPRIIAEKYMEDSETQELRDYKFFCFNGEVKLLFIASDRQVEGEDTKFDFYDADFKHLPFINGHPNSHEQIERPEGFEIMKSLAEKLSKDIPQVRIDFYVVNGEIKFGEITFFHWSGFVPFEPALWDKKIGDWIYISCNK